MPPTADIDVANQLQAAALGTVGVNIFSGKPKAQGGAVPAAAIFCRPYSWNAPQNYVNGGSNADELYFPAVQVLVRSAPNDELGGRAVARAALAATHDLPPAGYIQSRSQQSDVLDAGEDDAGCCLFSFNLYLIVEY